jgi:hypothetical protein
MTRRDVLDQARRKVERALMLADAADELAAAAESVLSEARGQGLPLDGLERALSQYRKVAGPSERLSP